MENIFKPYELLTKEEELEYKNAVKLYLEKQHQDRKYAIKYSISSLNDLKPALILGEGAVIVGVVTSLFVNWFYFYGVEVGNDFNYAYTNNICYMSYAMFKNYKQMIKHENKMNKIKQKLKVK